MNWKKISDELPPIGESVMLRFMYYNGPGVDDTPRYRGFAKLKLMFVFSDGHTVEPEYYTHWAKIEEPEDK